jgi:hypothetical protein
MAQFSVGANNLAIFERLSVVIRILGCAMG